MFAVGKPLSQPKKHPEVKINVHVFILRYEREIRRLDLKKNIRFIYT